jgi:hypothetical protein
VREKFFYLALGVLAVASWPRFVRGFAGDLAKVREILASRRGRQRDERGCQLGLGGENGSDRLEYGVDSLWVSGAAVGSSRPRRAVSRVMGERLRTASPSRSR